MRSPPSTRRARGGEGSGVGGVSARSSDSEFAALGAPPPPPPPPPPPGGGGGGCTRALLGQRVCRAPPPPRPLPAASRGEGGRRRLRPHQRDRFRQIADVIIGQREQHRVGAGGDQVADQARFCVLERQRAGQRRERVATIGIFDLTKITGQQPQLVVAAGLVGEAVEQFGKTVHASASSAGRASPSSSSP